MRVLESTPEPSLAVSIRFTYDGGALDRPALEVIRTTQLGETVLATCRSAGRAWTVSEVSDAVSVLHNAVLQTLIVSSGVQLALPSE